MVLSPALRAVARWLFAALGEPLSGVLSAAEMRAVLSEQGFSLRSDTGSSEWARALGRGARRARLFSGERLAIAARRQDG
jgi:hypothetical protein